MRKLFALLAVLATLTLPTAAQTPTSAAEWQRLYFTGALVNCACASTTVAETLGTFTLPAGILANVGDTVHLVAAGSVIGSTDNKNLSVKVGSQTPFGLSATTGGSLRWYLEVWITKSTTNVQTYASIGGNMVTTIGTGSGTTAQNDAAPIILAITALNSTTTTAASITMQYMTVDFVRGS
jgi:hypothetical protein